MSAARDQGAPAKAVTDSGFGATYGRDCVIFVAMSMVSLSRRQDAEVTASLEQRALEKLALVLCSHTQQLALAARSRGALGSREAGLQAEVFAERHAQVMDLLDTAAPEASEPRMARLERLIESIEFSRHYFMNV